MGNYALTGPKPVRSFGLRLLVLMIATQACNFITIPPVQNSTTSNSPSTAVAPSPSPSQAGRYRDPKLANFGVNLENIVYYNSTAIFADMAKMTSGSHGRWDNLTYTAEAQLDSTGAPVEPASTRITSDYPSGDYTVSWDGSGTLSFGSDKLSAITTSTNSDGSQHNTAILTHVRTTGSWITLKAVPPITHLQILAPASLTYSGSYFLNDYIVRLKPFSTLRFMGSQNINGSAISNWSERTWPNEGSRATRGGLAYEDVIALANLLNVDVWVNVPALATDDYVCRMARLFYYGEAGDKSDSPCTPSAPVGSVTTTPLNPSSKLYIEYSNEIWGGIPANRALVTQMATGASAVPSAIARAALANTSLPWATDPKTKTSQLAKVLEKRISDIVKGVFGPNKSQVKIVLAIQAVYPDGSAPGFDFFKAAYGPLSNTFDYIGTAPYFMAQAPATDTLDGLFAQLKSVALNPSPSTPQSVALYLTLDLAFANKYQLPLIAYEGGQALKGLANVAAQHDPRMFDMYQAYTSIWNQLVGKDHLFVLFTQVSSAESAGGAWGLLLHGEDLGSQKWDAVMSLSQIPGDANFDGVVDDADCQILRANFGKSGAWWMQGDFNHDGVVDQKDLDILNSHLPSGMSCVLY